LIATLACTLTCNSAYAGPPLLSDDPNTIGSGNLEGILAVSGFGFGSSGDILVPVFDLTLGVFEGIDLTFVAAPGLTVATDSATAANAVIGIGFKWQPIRGEHWRAAFTPSVAMNPPVVGANSLLLPIQLEYVWNNFSVGADAAYIFGFESSEQWFAALNAGWGATESLVLLAELWGGREAQLEEGAAGFTLGLDWSLPAELHMLMSGGSGFDVSSSRRVRWQVYLGLQRTFRLWGGE